MSPGFALEISNTEGDIYYTTDGSDPRLPGGAINPGATRIFGATAEFASLPAGSEWKFSDTGDLGTAWRAPDLRRLGMAHRTGSARVRKHSQRHDHRDGTVNAGIPPRQLTFYCRRHFRGRRHRIDRRRGKVQIQADGGAVVYINGDGGRSATSMPDWPDRPL